MTLGLRLYFPTLTIENFYLHFDIATKHRSANIQYFILVRVRDFRICSFSSRRHVHPFVTPRGYLH